MTLEVKVHLVNCSHYWTLFLLRCCLSRGLPVRWMMGLQARKFVTFLLWQRSCCKLNSRIRSQQRLTAIGSWFLPRAESENFSGSSTSSEAQGLENAVVSYLLRLLLFSQLHSNTCRTWQLSKNCHTRVFLFFSNCPLSSSDTACSKNLRFLWETKHLAESGALL